MLHYGLERKDASSSHAVDRYTQCYNLPPSYRHQPKYAKEEISIGKNDVWECYDPANLPRQPLYHPPLENRIVLQST